MKKSFATKIEPTLIKTLKSLSDKTRIPQAKFIEEALEDLFRKYDKEIKNIGGMKSE